MGMAARVFCQGLSAGRFDGTRLVGTVSAERDIGVETGGVVCPRWPPCWSPLMSVKLTPGSGSGRRGAVGAVAAQWAGGWLPTAKNRGQWRSVNKPKLHTWQSMRVALGLRLTVVEEGSGSQETSSGAAARWVRHELQLRQRRGTSTFSQSSSGISRPLQRYQLMGLPGPARAVIGDATAR